MNKVSIILPNYNSHKFIRKTLNSIITQTFIDWELIVVDDVCLCDGYKEVTNDV